MPVSALAVLVSVLLVAFTEPAYGAGRELRIDEMKWIAQADEETRDLGSSIWVSHPSGRLSALLLCSDTLQNTLNPQARNMPTSNTATGKNCGQESMLAFCEHL